MKVPFVEDNANELLAALQNKFLEFTRTFDQIKDYCKSLTYLGQNEYNKKKNEMYFLKPDQAKQRSRSCQASARGLIVLSTKSPTWKSRTLFLM